MSCSEDMRYTYQMAVVWAWPIWPVYGFFILNLIHSLFAAELVRHDASLSVDYILRATAQNISIACEERHSVVINKTFPAPLIRLKENQTSWIRVYNDMTTDNLTMVCPQHGSHNKH